MAKKAATARTQIDQTAQPLANLTQLGPYRVEHLIGAGGMGHVYLARDTRLRRKVAIKVLSPTLTRDDAAVERFTHEAHAVSALNHPNILTIYDIGAQDGIRYIATELVEGVTLRQRINEAVLGLHEIMDIAIQVAGALGVAHEAGIVHRDIKPENVMIRRDGIVKILDFGIAKLTRFVAKNDESVQTAPGLVIGTVQYMSPEQARGLSIDGRSDIFSLGVMLYEMIAGRLPFAGETTSDQLANLLTRTPLPLSTVVNGIPLALDQLVTRALSKERERRYGTAAELLAGLKLVNAELATNNAFRPGPIVDPAADVSTRILPVNPVNAAPTRRRRTGTVRKAIDSLAVLPFTNDLSDPEADYLSDGITESIINSLSVLPKVRVVPRSTVFRFRGNTDDPIAIGRELGVRAVFTGRLQQVADSLVFKTELIDVANESQIWGEQYRRELTDLFALQSEIAEDISSKLKVKLTGAQKTRLRKRYTENTEAYQYYLKGRYFVTAKRTGEWIQKGIEYFQRAIDLDPNYALAYAGIAEAYGFFASSTGGWRPRDAYPKAIAAAEKALELDDTLAEAHCSLGFSRLLYDWDFNSAKSEFERAITLNPNFPTALDGYGFYCKALGRHNEAIENGKQALRLDPLSAFAHVSLGYAYYFAREYQNAADECNRALEMDRYSSFAYRTLGQSLMQLGQVDAGLDALNKAVTFASGGSVFASALGFAYGVAGLTEEAKAVLNQLTALQQTRYVPAFDISMVHLGLGDNAQSLDWLEMAAEERSGFMPFLKVEPMVDALRQESRFRDLLITVGLSA